MADLITPPPELVQQWVENWHSTPGLPDCRYEYIATQAAQWGADQELEACCEWLTCGGLLPRLPALTESLLAARRPKPPSLKEQALGALGRFNTNTHTRADEMTQDFDLIRTALEAIDD
jgi:hypothetical protein